MSDKLEVTLGKIVKFVCMDSSFQKLGNCWSKHKRKQVGKLLVYKSKFETVIHTQEQD